MNGGGDGEFSGGGVEDVFLAGFEAWGELGGGQVSRKGVALCCRCCTYAGCVRASAVPPTCGNVVVVAWRFRSRLFTRSG